MHKQIDGVAAALGSAEPNPKIVSFASSIIKNIVVFPALSN